MPVFAVGAAVVATAIAIDTGTTFAIVAAVGATIGAVGAIAKIPALTYIGAGLGAIGGIGALATSAGLLGSDAATQATSAFGIDGSAAATGADAQAQVASAFAGDTGIPAGADSIFNAVSPAVSSDVANAAVGDTVFGAGTEGAGGAATAATAAAPDFSITNPAAPSTQAAPQPLVGATGEENAASAQPTAGLYATESKAAGNIEDITNDPNNPNTVSGQPASTVSANATAPTVTGSPASATDAATQQVPTPASLNPAGDVTGTGGTGGGGYQVGSGGGGSGNSSIFGNIAGFLAKNPGLAYGATQALGNFISGATSTLTPAQVAALNAQAAANTAAASLTSRQVAAQSSPKAVASLSTPTTPPPPLIQVTGVPNLQAPQMSGLINSTGATPA